MRFRKVTYKEIDELKKNPQWEDWNSYFDEEFAYWEVGKIGDVHYIEVNNETRTLEDIQQAETRWKEHNVQFE